MGKRKKARQKPQRGLDSPIENKALEGRKEARRGQTREPYRASLAQESSGWPLEAVPTWLSELPELKKTKKGRPTIPDNLLLGSRNNWLSFFEECWPEIGFSLVAIRKQQKGTLETIRKAFEPVAGKDRFALSQLFLRGALQPVEGKELRANRIRDSKLRYEIQAMHSQRLERVRSCSEAEKALTQAGEVEKEIIQTQANQRKQRLHELEEKLGQAEKESKELDKKVQDQETYWYCSQLLDFLHKGRYAVEPLNLGKALAGLPEMGWRGSFARCSKMERSSSFVHFPYRVFEVVSRIWRRRPKDLQVSPTEFFRAQILKLPKKKDDGTRDALCRGWRDVRLAIEECWKVEHGEDFMPYAITSAFLRNHQRQKTATEQVLDEHEALSKGRADA